MQWFWRKNTQLDPRVYFLAVAWGINSLAFSIVYPYIPIYLHQIRGFSMAQAGLIFPLMGLGHIFSQPISGYLADRYGRRKILISGPFIRSVLFFGLAFMAHLDAPLMALGAGLFCSSFIGGFFINASDAYIADISTPAERTEAFSLVRVGLNVGWMIGPAIGAFMATSPFALLFCITGSLTLVLSFISYRFCPETLPPRDQHADQATLTWRYSFKNVSRMFLMFLVCCFILSSVFSQLVSTLSVFSTSIVGISKNHLGYLYSINGLVVILFQVPVNRWLKHHSLHGRIAFGCICFALGYLSISWATAWIHLMISIIIFTAGEILTQPAIATTISHIAPQNARARYMALSGFMRSMGHSIGPFLGGMLFDRFAQQPLWMWGPVAAASLLAAAGFYRVRVKTDEDPPLHSAQKQ